MSKIELPALPRPPVKIMETVITRDTDILREYLIALDARERGLSPFARLAATVKLAQLRRELDRAQVETTDEDVATLRREIDERLNRSMARRFESKRWGARLSIFLMLVLGQQLVLALVWLLTMLFVRTAPMPRRWNPVLPHEQPVFLFIFIFFFFFMTPMLALLALFGGRFLRSWRRTLPATLLIFALSVLGTFLVVYNKEKENPVRHSTSLSQFSKDRGMNVLNYQQWVEGNWLMKDEKFRRDYESYLRNGPGRWITSRFSVTSDAGWRDSLAVMNEYLDGGQDPNGFRDWLKYYLDRNRIYSEDRIDQEVSQITNGDNQRFLGIWQVEPFLKERDERLYRAYLGSVNRSMKGWGIASLALFTLIFLVIYLTGPALSMWERMAGNVRTRARRGSQAQFDPDQHIPPTAQRAGRVARWRERYYSFPEQREITTPPFFDTPFKLLSQVHRAFVRLAVFTSILVFGFWAVVYAADLAAGRENVPSQVALMRSHLLFGGIADADSSEGRDLMAKVSADTAEHSPNYASVTAAAASANLGEPNRETLLAARVLELERRLDESDYLNTKKFKEQNQIIATQRSEINQLKGLPPQFQQTTLALTEQLAGLNERTSAADARASGVLGEVAAAKQTAEGLEKQITAKLGEVETRAARAADQVGKVEDQTSVLATRTEALEKELDRRARQVEARTEELGERTAGISEREERITRFQRITFAAIVSNIRAEVDELDRRLGSAFYRLFSKGEARRDAEALRERIAEITRELREVNTDQARELIQQLEELNKRVEDIAVRVK
jgi:hypothetical protein